MLLLEVVVVCALVVLSLAFLVTVKDNNCSLPGPKRQSWLLGNLVLLGKKGYHVCHLDWLKDYGSLYRYYMGRQRVVCVSEVSIMREMCFKRFSSFHDRPLPPYSHPESLRGIIFSRGNYWTDIRRKMTPLFRTKNLEILASVALKHFLELRVNLEHLQNGAVVDMQEVTEMASLEVMCKVVFGVDFDSQRVSVDNDFGKAFTSLEKSTSKITFASVLVLIFPQLRWIVHHILPKIPFLQEYRNRMQRNFILGKCQKIITQRREQTSEGPKDGEFSNMVSRFELAGFGNPRGDITESDLTIIAYNMLGAGSSTTGTTVSCLLFELAKNPEIQANISREIQEFLQRKCRESISERPEEVLLTKLTVSELSSHFRFLEMAVKETLRLYPSGAIIAREATENSQLGTHLVQKGTPVLIPVYALHRDPLHYPEPERFNPSRFDPLSPDFNPSTAIAFVPFGLGPRMCVGYKFALHEVMMAAIVLLERFRFELPEDSTGELLLNAGLNLKPKHGVNLALFRRSL